MHLPGAHAHQRAGAHLAAPLTTRAAVIDALRSLVLRSASRSTNEIILQSTIIPIACLMHTPLRFVNRALRPRRSEDRMRVPRSVIIATLLAAVSIGIPALAWAEPVGCTSRNDDFHVDSVGFMTNEGSGTCAGVATRTLRSEIKQDLNNRPDALVSAGSYNYTGKSYFAYTGSCDRGKTATYYGRTFFTTSSTYHDSSHYYKHVCS